MLLVDVHPAEVTLPDGSRHDLVRVALTNRRLRIWAEVARTPELLFEAAHQGIALDTLHPLVGRSMTWATDAGEVVVTRMRGCGCGSSLRALRPPSDND
jgi:hypothetical protein